MLKLFQSGEEALVSVIIPAYNVERYIEKCIASVCAQTYKNLEIIIVITESDDKTEELCRKSAKLDTRITCLKCKKKGVSNARNIALKRVKGKYVAFVDADDYVEVDYIELLCENIQEYDLSICGFDRVKSNEIKIELFGKNFIYTDAEVLSNILCDNRIGGYLWNKLFRVDLIEEANLRFMPELTIGEDMVFIAAYVKHIKKAKYCNRVAYHYRINPESALQKMYMTGEFEMKKMSNMLAARYIAKMYAFDDRMIVQEAISYRNVRTALWTMFNMLKCEYYNAHILNEIKRIMKKNRYSFCKNKNAKLIEKISVCCVCISSKLSWIIFCLMLKIVPSKMLRKYVNS